MRGREKEKGVEVEVLSINVYLEMGTEQLGRKRARRSLSEKKIGTLV